MVNNKPHYGVALAEKQDPAVDGGVLFGGKIARVPGTRVALGAGACQQKRIEAKKTGDVLAD